MSFILPLFTVAISSYLSLHECFPVHSLTMNTSQVVDLTYPFNKETVYWAWDYTNGWDFNLSTIVDGYQRGYYYRSNRFHVAEHGGTHIDTPLHLKENGTDAASIGASALIGPAVVIDITSKTAGNPNYALAEEDVVKWESLHGPVPDGAFVFMFSDWGKNWPDKKQIFGSEDIFNMSSLQFPAFDISAVKYLVEKRDIRGIGVDTGSIDSPPNFGSFVVHRYVADAGRLGLEFVANLDKLPAKGAWVVVAPMKITEGTGAPTQIFAMLPNDGGIG